MHRSAITRAAAASTTTTALGTMHGSCLPSILMVVSSIFVRSTVRCSLAMDAVGLKATRNSMGMPLLMPPSTPPASFFAVREPSLHHHERVVVLRAAHAGGPEARTELDALDRGDGEHHLGQFALDRVEERLAQSDRHTVDEATAPPRRRCRPPLGPRGSPHASSSITSSEAARRSLDLAMDNISWMPCLLDIHHLADALGIGGHHDPHARPAAALATGPAGHQRRRSSGRRTGLLRGCRGTAPYLATAVMVRVAGPGHVPELLVLVAVPVLVAR